MNEIKFGPSGNSTSFYDDGMKSTEQTAGWLFKRGLNAFEYSFGRGVNLSSDKAVQICNSMVEHNVSISVHAPYYINFANTDPEMIEKSFGYVLKSAEKLRQLGGNRCVFHSASLGKLSRTEAMNITKDNISRLVEKIYANGFDDIFFCPETMGKINQIGDFREVAEICKIDKILIPTVDFGHQNARTLGGLLTEADFEEIIQCFNAEIGAERTANMHIHFSKIEYSNGGEVRHLTFDDERYGPDFNLLAKVLKKYEMSPVVICESAGTQAEDALKMKKMYEAL